MGPVYDGEREFIYTPIEQTLMKSRTFMDLAPFHFMAAITQTEGKIATKMRLMDVSALARQPFPDADEIAAYRSYLMSLHGRHIDDILKEVDARRQDGPAPSSRSMTARSRVIPFADE
jgi:hypothetical protein